MRDRRGSFTDHAPVVLSPVATAPLAPCSGDPRAGGVGGDGDEQLVAGAIFGRVQPRIVRVDGFRLEAIPEGSSLLIRNSDQPGVVGVVGTVLGEAGINISRMQLGLQLDGKRALQLLNVNPRPSAQVLDALRAHPAVENVHLLDLGALVV